MRPTGIIVHESDHYLIAKLFGCNPIFKKYYIKREPTKNLDFFNILNDYYEYINSRLTITNMVVFKIPKNIYKDIIITLAGPFSEYLYYLILSYYIFPIYSYIFIIFGIISDLYPDNSDCLLYPNDGYLIYNNLKNLRYI